MKKRVLVFCTLMVFLFSCFACGKAPSAELPEDASSTPAPYEPGLTYHEVYDSDTDFDNRFGMYADSVVETEDAYYYLSYCGNYLYYYDKASGERGVLCGKPECTHDAERENSGCGGYAAVSGTTLNYLNGKLYYLAQDISNHCYAVYTLNPDGSEKTREALVDLNSAAPGFTPHRCDLHRGMFYASGQFQTVVSAVPTLRTCILSIDPENGEIKTIYTVDEKLAVESTETYTDPETGESFDYAEYDQTSVSDAPALFYYRQYVYFCLCREDADEDGTKHSVIELRRFDTETEQTEEVWLGKTEKAIGRNCRIWVEAEDRIYLMPAGAPEGASAALYLLSGGELKPVFAFDRSGTGFLSDGVAACYDQQAHYMELRDLTGEVIFAGMWELDASDQSDPKTTENGYITSFYGDRSRVFASYYLFPQDGSGTLRKYLVSYDLTGGSPQAELIAFDPW